MTSLEEVKQKFSPAVQTSFDDLMAGATVIDSGTLEQDKFLLIGVPHLITRVTYRPRTARQERGYVSVEATIASLPHIAQAVRRKWMPGVEDMGAFPFTPEEKIVYNDGGTGIRRQLTMVLHAQDYLNIGDVEDNRSFDRDWMEWDSFATSIQQNDGDGKIDVPDFQHLRIFAAHGLRVSEYDADGIDAKTFYLS